MAKHRPTWTLAEMESEMGYQVESATSPSETVQRFYSDLRPVPDDIYERTKREFDEYKRLESLKHNETISSGSVPSLAVVETVACGVDKVTLTQTNHLDFYRFAVEIQYGFDLDLQLLFTEAEALQTVSLAKLQPRITCKMTSIFFKLPLEIRNHIYNLAIPEGEWNGTDIDGFDTLDFPSAVGDLDGFYFPLNKNLVILHINKQIRQEALPLAYRRTFFRMDDIDDLIRFLISIGRIGRDNIQSIEFLWEGKADSEAKWVEYPDSDDNFLKLPELHVPLCIQLLRQCKRLKFLRILFESELILTMSVGSFQADAGIQGLCSIAIVENVEICSLGGDSLHHSGLAKWLKEQIEGSE